MKTREILSAAFICLAMVCNAQILRHPSFLYCDNNTVKVTRIEYAPDATILTFKTTKECVPTLKVDHGIFIVDDNGQRHYAINADGIKLDSLYIMPEGETRRFSISFDPASESNQALDVRGSGMFSIYGLHDADSKLDIPKAQCEVNNNEVDSSCFKTDWVDIEGVFHDDSDKNSTIYARYNTERTSIRENKYNKYSTIDDEGRFHMRFLMYAPSNVQLSRGQFSAESFGEIYLHPGDKVHVDIYKRGRSIEVISKNLVGKKSYNNLMNAPVIAPDILWFNSLVYHYAYNETMYNDCAARLNKGYAKALKCVDYICWHYKFSPYESALYTECINAKYVKMLTSLALLRQSAGGAVDYSYLRYLDPENVTIPFICTETLVPAIIVQLSPFRKCHEQVDENDANRWMKVIDLQHQEFERIMGHSGYPFLFQMMVVEDYASVFNWKPADERQYQQVRDWLTSPYCKKRLDIIHGELLDKSKTISGQTTN